MTAQALTTPTELATLVCTDVERTPLLATLMSILPAARARLEDATAWRGFLVDDDGAQRERLVCRDRIRDRAHGRVYSLALHRFTDVGAQTAMHDHRVPLAVFPFREGAGDDALYEMAWRDRQSDRDGAVTVRHRQPWAIVEHSRVLHAVRTLRPHCSVILGDVTSPPSRIDRLASTPLPEDRVDELRRALSRSLLDACG